MIVHPLTFHFFSLFSSGRNKCCRLFGGDTLSAQNVTKIYFYKRILSALGAEVETTWGNGAEMVSLCNLMDYVYQLQFEAGRRRSVTDYVLSCFGLIGGNVFFTEKLSADAIRSRTSEGSCRQHSGVWRRRRKEQNVPVTGWRKPHRLHTSTQKWRAGSLDFNPVFWSVFFSANEPINSMKHLEIKPIIKEQQQSREFKSFWNNCFCKKHF